MNTFYCIVHRTILQITVSNFMMSNKSTVDLIFIDRRLAFTVPWLVTTLSFKFFITCCLFLDGFSVFFVRVVSISTRNDTRIYVDMGSLLGNLCGALLLYARIDTLKQRNGQKIKVKRNCIAVYLNRWIVHSVAANKLNNNIRALASTNTQRLLLLRLLLLSVTMRSECTLGIFHQIAI